MHEPDIDQQIASLKEELSRMDADFDAQLKSLGLTLESLEDDIIPHNPEAERLFAVAQEEAVRAGKARASQYQTASNAEGVSPSSALRRGAIRP